MIAALAEPYAPDYSTSRWKTTHEMPKMQGLSLPPTHLGSVPVKSFCMTALSVDLPIENSVTLS